MSEGEIGVDAAITGPAELTGSFGSKSGQTGGVGESVEAAFVGEIEAGCDEAGIVQGHFRRRQSGQSQ